MPKTPSDYSDYSSLEKAQDAGRFIKTRFGAHYLARLRTAKETNLTLAMNCDLTDSFRAHCATKAATVQSELDYFTTSQQIISNPSLVARLRDKLKTESPPIV